MNVHVGETPSGNPFYIMPEGTGFHVNIFVTGTDKVYYEYIQSGSLSPEDVQRIVTNLEEWHVSWEGKQITSGSNIEG